MVCRLSYALLEGCRGRWGTLQSPVSTHAHTEQSVPYTNVRSTSPRTLKESLQSYRCIGTILLRLLSSNRFHTVIQYHIHSLYQHKQSFACQICYKRNDCTTGHCISLVYMSTPDERKKLSYGKRLFLSNIQAITRQSTCHTLCVEALSRCTQSRETIVSIWHCLHSTPPLWLQHRRVHNARRAVKRVTVPFAHTVQ